MSREVTHQQWLDEARERFGPEAMNWRFVCPSCGHVAAVKDWRAVGAPEGAIAFSCVGRWMEGPVMEIGPVAGGPKKGPCNYAGGGLFRMNPVHVTHSNGARHSVFEFAPAEDHTHCTGQCDQASVYKPCEDSGTHKAGGVPTTLGAERRAAGEARSDGSDAGLPHPQRPAQS